MLLHSVDFFCRLKENPKVSFMLCSKLAQIDTTITDELVTVVADLIAQEYS